MSGGHGDRGRGRIEFRADDEALTPYAGLACVGELERQTGLVELIDAELACELRVAPVKRRRRGVSGAELVVSLAESQLVGGECFDHIEDLRADAAGAPLRAVARVPSAPAALGLAKRFRRSLCQAVERGLGRAGHRLDRALGRDACEPVTIDLDAQVIEVYGRKRGASRNRSGQLSFAPHIAFWAERGRALTGELVAGAKEKLAGSEAATLCRRALRLLPAGHGQVTFRIDSAYYALDLLRALRSKAARFTVSVPRTSAMWGALGRIPEDAWQEAIDMPGAEVAETTYTPNGWGHEPLRLIVRRTCFSARELSLSRGPAGCGRSTPSSSSSRSAARAPRSTATASSSATSTATRRASSTSTATAPRSRSASRRPSSARRCATCPPATRTPTASGSPRSCASSTCRRCSVTLAARPSLGAGARGRAAAPPRQDLAPRTALRSRPHRPSRPAHDPAPRLGLPPLSALQATWAAAYALPPP